MCVRFCKGHVLIDISDKGHMQLVRALVAVRRMLPSLEIQL